MKTGKGKRARKPRKPLPDMRTHVAAKLRERLDRVLDHIEHHPPELSPYHARELAKSLDQRNTILLGRASIGPGGCAEFGPVEAKRDTVFTYIDPGDHEWPDTIPLALQQIRSEADLLVQETLDMMVGAATSTKTRGKGWLIPEKLQHSVLVRMSESFPWSMGPWAGRLVHVLISLSPSRIKSEIPLGHWHPEAAALDVAKWLEGHTVLGFPFSEEITREVFEVYGFSSVHTFHESNRPFVPGYAFAVMRLAVQAVERDQHRQRIAVDAGKTHSRFLGTVRDMPALEKSEEVQMLERNDICCWQLDIPGREPKMADVQLLLPMEGIRPNEATIHAIRELGGPSGLRHWAALLRQLSVEGARSGIMRWTMRNHLEALGYTERQQKSLGHRQEIARQVELLTAIRLIVYAASGKKRSWDFILAPLGADEKLEGSQWTLEGLRLKVHPLLYSGVRKESGRLGENYFPATVELPKIDHNRFPYATTIGLILSVRWRMAMGGGKFYVRIAGENLLKLAGMKFTRRRAVECWDRLEANLDELKRRGVLARWEWLREIPGERSGPQTMAGIFELHPPDWTYESWLGAKQIEAPRKPQILTGEELRNWRQREGLNQAKAAERLKAHKSTILRAEQGPKKALSRKLSKALDAGWEPEKSGQERPEK